MSVNSLLVKTLKSKRSTGMDHTVWFIRELNSNIRFFRNRFVCYRKNQL